MSGNEQRPGGWVINGPRLRVLPKRYGKRLSVVIHVRRRTADHYRSGIIFVDPLPKPTSLGVRLGVSFYPENEDGQRTLTIGLLVVHIHADWTPAGDR